MTALTQCSVTVETMLRDPGTVLWVSLAKLQATKFYRSKLLWLQLTPPSLPQNARMCQSMLITTNTKIKVHPTPKFFFAKIIKLILWSNLAQNFFDLVKSSSSYAPSKYVQMLPLWFVTQFNGAWVEGRM